MSDTALLGKDLSLPPSATIEIDPKPLPDVSKIGTKDFVIALNKALKSKKSVWRTSKNLAFMLEVDVKDLDVYLKTREDIESKKSKEEGVFLYALKERLSPEPKTSDKKKVASLVSEEDRYALSKIHDALSILEMTLKKYGTTICDRSPEAFNSLVKGKSCVEGGMYLYATATKSNLDKL